MATADQRPWKIHRNHRGHIRWYQRWFEAWWILRGQWSLHRAYQHGLDEGSRREYQRIIVNGGDLLPVMNAAIIETRARTPKGSLPTEIELREISRGAWDRYRRSNCLAGLAS